MDARKIFQDFREWGQWCKPVPRLSIDARVYTIDPIQGNLKTYYPRLSKVPLPQRVVKNLISGGPDFGEQAKGRSYAHATEQQILYLMLSDFRSVGVCLMRRNQKALRRSRQRALSKGLLAR